MSGAAVSPATAAVPRCTLCSCKIFLGTGDDLARGLCRDCKARPEAPRGPGNGHKPAAVAPGPRALVVPPQPRAFNAAEKALVRSLHQLPAAQLLDILNGRAAAEPNHVPFTLAQLQAELETLLERTAAADDWSSLRQLIARARRSGLLATITLQLVDDFSVVFRLSPAQHMRLRDVIRNAQEER